MSQITAKKEKEKERENTWWMSQEGNKINDEVVGEKENVELKGENGPRGSCRTRGPLPLTTRA